MPFNREWRLANGEPAGYFVNRDRTGTPVNPQPGVVQTTDGIIVGADTNIVGDTNVVLQPDKSIKVTMPGPREPVLTTGGIMAPRWRRFFEELYRRTGALEDNVNAAEFSLAGAGTGTTGSLAITGNAPTIVFGIRYPTTASATLTGQDVTIVNTS